MPNTKSDNRTVEIKMDDKLDVQADIIISGIKLNLLSTKIMIMERTNVFKYWMHSNLNILLD